MRTPRGPWRAVLIATAVLLVALPHLARWRLLQVRGFGPDEFEHLHFSWSISKGLLPYRDYFDHHTPGLHYLLEPIFHGRDVERSVTDAFEAIFLARRITWVFAGASLLLTFALGRAWRDARTGLVAALLFGNTAIFLRKALEVRPDVPATGLCLAALWLGLLAMSPTASRRLALFAASGLLLGTAVMFTQKALFIGPGWLLALALYVADGRRTADLARRLRGVAVHGAAAALPLALTLAFFAAHGAAGAFLHFNFLLNLDWPGLGPRAFVVELLRRDPHLAALGLAGAVIEAWRLWRQPAGGWSLLLLSAVSLVGSLFVLPAVTFHYFLFFLPLVATLAAAVVVDVLDRLGHRFALPGIMRDGLLALVLTLTSLPALDRLRDAFTHTNQGTLDGIRFVLRNTAPGDPVLDGFSGLGVFRPLVGFYGFLHRDNWAIQSEDERARLVRSLLRAEVSPKLVFWDHYLKEPVPPALATFIERHYAPLGPDPIWVRLDDGGAGWWTDEGRRSLGWPAGQERTPHLFVGEGWKQPEDFQGTSVRATRGRVAELWIPLQEPRVRRVVIRAWTEAPRAALRLNVNDARLGESCLAAGWSDYAFEVPPEVQRRGLNRFVLSFPSPGPSTCPGPGAERAELKVESVELPPRL
jgi:hypothetical protein